MSSIQLLILSAVFRGIEKTLYKKYVPKDQNLEFSCLWSFFGLLWTTFYFLLFGDWKVATAWPQIALAFLSSLIWFGGCFFEFKSYPLLELGKKVILSRSRLLIILAIAVLFFDEQLSFSRISGCFLILCGLILSQWQKTQKTEREEGPGVIFAVLAACSFAIAISLDKALGTFFDPFLYSALMFLGTNILFHASYHAQTKGDYQSYKSQLKSLKTPLLLTSFLGSTAYLFLILAFKMSEELSLAIPITESGGVFALILGIIFLKERNHITRKLIAILLITVGTFLL